MRCLRFIALVFLASFIVFVECQDDQRCSKAQDCDSGCCYEGHCNTNEFLCEMVKEERKYEKECFSDLTCSTGCCINYKCKPKSSVQCIEKNSCTTNSDCDSECCENNQCQPFCFTLPTFKINYDECSSSSDCFLSGKGSCCVGGFCSPCSRHGISHGSAGSSSHSSGGTNVGIVIAVIVLLIIKIAIWVSWCSRRQRRGVVVARRRVVACVAEPIVQNDELQREHESAEQGIPDRPPPACSPTPESHDNSTQNAGGVPNNGEGIVNTSYDGAQRGSQMLPPLAYDPSPAPEAGENAHSVRAGQAQRGAGAGTIEDDEPQGSTMIHPPPYFVAMNQQTTHPGPSTPKP